MSTSMKKKLLVALDGSTRSIETVRYLTQMPAFEKMQIHLFHVFESVPQSYWDLQKEPAAISNIASLRAWESQHRARIDEHMNVCREILLSHDFHPGNIHVHIVNRKSGIARDIIAEARKGYAALVLRRRGKTRLQKLVLGSTAQKLLYSLSDVPLVFAGRKTDHSKVLIGFDGSENAMRAVDFAGKMLAPGRHSITLIGVLRMHSNALSADDGNFAAIGDRRPLSLDTLNRSFIQASECLYAYGFSTDAVTSRIVSDIDSRAGAIVDLAEKEGLGTIIIGRKGHSRVDAFGIGRVSSKILMLGAPFSVWIVN